MTARSCLTTGSSCEDNGHQELGTSRSCHPGDSPHARKSNYVLTFKWLRKGYNRWFVTTAKPPVGESVWLINLLTHLSHSPSMKL
jgi:hypothetical protein